MTRSTARRSMRSAARLRPRGVAIETAQLRCSARSLLVLGTRGRGAKTRTDRAGPAGRGIAGTWDGRLYQTSCWSTKLQGRAWQLSIDTAAAAGGEDPGGPHSRATLLLRPSFPCVLASLAFASTLSHRSSATAPGHSIATAPDRPLQHLAAVPVLESRPVDTISISSPQELLGFSTTLQLALVSSSARTSRNGRSRRHMRTPAPGGICSCWELLCGQGEQPSSVGEGSGSGHVGGARAPRRNTPATTSGIRGWSCSPAG
jgi:hypothetical protein